MAAFLARFLFISIFSIALASIKDFIIESESDLMRLGQSTEIALDDETEYYDNDDLTMCDDTASHSNYHDFNEAINYGDDCGDYDIDESAISLNNVMQNGQLDVNMLRRAINKLSKDPQFFSMFEHAYLHEGIPSDMEVQDYAGCQTQENSIDVIYNGNMVE